MAGRGTDIELSKDAHAAGGLHVILTSFHETSRIDRQLEGRAGRQGDPGSAQAITAIDDELYTLFAPRAAKALRSEEHTSELQSLMRTSYAVFCLKTKKTPKQDNKHQQS